MTNKAIDKANLELALVENNKKILEHTDAADTALREKLNAVSQYQKYLNTGLDYGYFVMSNATQTDVTDIVLFDTRESGNIEVNNGLFSLKSGKTYKISYRLYGESNGASDVFYGLYNYTDSAFINDYFASLLPVNYSGKFTTQDGFEYVYTPEKDCEICIKHKSNYYFKTLYKESSYLFIEEINRQIIIDPLEHVNMQSGIEDIPVGHTISCIGTNEPKHYLICDGKEYNILDYPYLAEYIKTEFGIYNIFGGDGVTTFAVPNYSTEYDYFSPIMTSNSTPSPYVVTASSTYSSSFMPYMAFDNKTNTAWASISKGFPAWLKIDLGKPIYLGALKITSTFENSVSTAFTIEGSNDDVEYIVLKDYSTDSWASSTEREILFDKDKVGCYRYIKLNVTKSSDNSYAEFGNILFGIPQKIECIKYEPTYYMNVFGLREETVLFEGKEEIPVTTKNVYITTITPLPDISEYNAFNVEFYELSGNYYCCMIDTKYYCEMDNFEPYKDEYCKSVQFISNDLSYTISAQLCVLPEHSGSLLDNGFTAQNCFSVWNIKGSKATTLYLHKITGIKYRTTTEGNVTVGGGTSCDCPTYTDEEISLAIDSVLGGI